MQLVDTMQRCYNDIYDNLLFPSTQISKFQFFCFHCMVGPLIRASATKNSVHLSPFWPNSHSQFQICQYQLGVFNKWPPIQILWSLWALGVVMWCDVVRCGVMWWGGVRLMKVCFFHSQKMQLYSIYWAHVTYLTWKANVHSTHTFHTWIDVVYVNHKRKGTF